MLVDLHVHAGEGALDPEAVLVHAPSLGLDGVVFVGRHAFPDLRAVRGRAVRAFAAAEVESDRGHYLVFLPDPDALPPLEAILGAPTDSGVPVRDVLARTRALGGAVVAAHPYDTGVAHPGGDIVFTLPGLAAIESVNARHGAELAHRAIEAAETLGLPCTGGSDARTLQDVGRGATLFTRSFEDEAGLVAALRSGACWPVEFGELPADLQRRRPQQQAPRESGSGQPREGGGGRRRRRR